MVYCSVPLWQIDFAPGIDPDMRIRPSANLFLLTGSDWSIDQIEVKQDYSTVPIFPRMHPFPDQDPQFDYPFQKRLGFRDCLVSTSLVPVILIEQSPRDLSYRTGQDVYDDSAQNESGNPIDFPNRQSKQHIQMADRSPHDDASDRDDVATSHDRQSRSDSRHIRADNQIAEYGAKAFEPCTDPISWQIYHLR